jgi:hypothetical protein
MTTAPYGSWKSPISADLVAGASVSLDDRQDPGAEPRPITPEPATPAGLRYADATLTPDGAWLICVRESHEGPEVTGSGRLPTAAVLRRRYTCV